MATLANLQGASLVPSLAQTLQLMLQSSQEQRAVDTADAEAVRQAEIAKQIELIQPKPGADPAAQRGVEEAAMLRLTAVAPNIAKIARGIITQGDEEAKAALRAEAVKGARTAAFLLKQPDEAATVRAIGVLARDASARGEPLDKLIALSNMKADERGLELQRMQIAAQDINTLLKPVETFAPVLDAAGNIVAQTSDISGRAFKDPRAGGDGGDSFAKSPGVISRTAEGVTMQIPVMNKGTGQVELKSVPIPGKVVSRLGETGTELSLRRAGEAGRAELEKRLAQLETAGAIKGAEKRGGAEETRVQGIINRGLDAADTVPILNRSIELLNAVETGGFDAAALRAKQLFGVESADEAELSSNLGKTVLSQLRTTFGAAFTEREGARLARIEAAFGKSIEGNKRLLRQTKKIAERGANRAIKAAEKAGDFDTADEIRDAMQFSLTPEAPTTGAPTTPGATAGPQEGATATNPTTGATIIFRGGQWQTL